MVQKNGGKWGFASQMLDNTFHASYIPSMAWQVEYTDEFEDWWNELTEAEQEEINAKVILLEERGTVLPRPHADVITSSRHPNMKELRGWVMKRGKKRQLRVLYAFDIRRHAILLLGGDKTDDPRWYEKYVPLADDLFDRHLKQLQKEAAHGKKVQQSKK